MSSPTAPQPFADNGQAKARRYGQPVTEFCRARRHGRVRWEMNINFRGVVYFVALSVTLCGLAFGPSSAIVKSGTSPAVAETGAAASTGTPLVAGFGLRLGAWQQPGEVVVQEQGDPDAPPETLVVNEAEVRNTLEESRAQSAFSRRQRQYKEGKLVALTMLDLALKFARKNPTITRQSNPRQIRKFTSLWGYKDETPPYCAMGLAFVASMAYCTLPPARITYSERSETKTLKDVLPLITKYYFTPDPSCRNMMAEAKKKGASQTGGWVAKGKKRPKPGWAVLFDWDRNGVPDHVGLVKAVTGRRGNSLSTVEFNTCIKSAGKKKCGAVAEQVRPMSSVIGFIRTY